MNMKYFQVFGAITAIGTQVGMKVVSAMEDDVLDGPEIGDIVKTSINALRMAGVSHADLDKIQVITSRAGYEALPFKDGDVLIYGPSELTGKLKVKV